jgi:preprotein translocase subunit SecG
LACCGVELNIPQGPLDRVREPYSKLDGGHDQAVPAAGYESEDFVLIQQWLPAIQIVEIILSVAVIFFILLQVRGAGLGSAFGGTSAGSVFKTRRGVERLVFNMTIIFVVLFSLIAVLVSALQGRL